MACGRCRELYCSQECQRNDWREHKYYCFAMPGLVTLPSLNGQADRIVQNGTNGREHRNERDGREQSNQLSHQQCSAVNTSVASNASDASTSPPWTFCDPPSNGDDVVLTSVKSANVYYIRSCRNNNEYKMCADEFDRHGRNALRLIAVPQKNDIVLVRHNGIYHRAVVLSSNNTDADIKIALVDLGRKVQKRIHDMREMSEELKRRTRHNYILALEHVPSKMEASLFKKITTFVEKETVFTLRFDGDDWATAKNVKLFEKGTGTPIEVLIGVETNHVSTKNTVEQQPSKGPSSNTSVARTQRSEEPSSTTSAIPNRGRDEPINSSAPAPNKKVEPIISSPTPSSSNNEVISPKKLTLADLTSSNVELPNLVDLMITDSTTIEGGYVSAIEKKNAQQFHELHSKVQKYGERSREVYECNSNELCLVKWEGEWYRAASFDSQFLLIDWGACTTIERNDVRQYPEELTDKSCLLTCNLIGFSPERDGKYMEAIKELLSDLSEHRNCECERADDAGEYNVRFPAIKELIGH